MHTKVYVETSREGSDRFVRLQRANTTSPTTSPITSPHHHHHRHRHHHKHEHHDPPPSRHCTRHASCLHVPLEDWNDLVRAERSLRKKYEKLACENRTLKDSLARQASENKALSCRVRELCESNDALRRSLDGAIAQAERQTREAARWRREVERLSRDNDCMAVRIRELSRGCRRDVKDSLLAQVDEFRRVARAWQEKFECAQGAVDEKVGVIEGQRDTIAVYERLLRRHGIVAC